MPRPRLAAPPEPSVTRQVNPDIYRACLLLVAQGLILAVCSPAIARELVGQWQLETTGFAFGGATAPVDLSIEENDGRLEAFVYNGPVPLRVDGNEFEIDIDWATPFDTMHLSTLRGRLTDSEALEGVVDHNGDRNFLGAPMQNGRFTGHRATPRPVAIDEGPDPVDLSGVWNRAFGLWPLRKLNYAMTPAGQRIIDGYDEMDNPNSRCASMGLVMASGMPYPMEIVHADDHIMIVYGADYARRVYLDGREFPDTAVSSSLGFSTGEWRGDTLVVTTRELSPAFMSTRGQPVSADAYTIEHIYIDDRGYLHADMWLHDPKNYRRPPYIKRSYDRDFSPTVITKVGCDPYSFFRALYLDGKLEEFWSRSATRR